MDQGVVPQHIPHLTAAECKFLRENSERDKCLDLYLSLPLLFYNSRLEEVRHY